MSLSPLIRRLILPALLLLVPLLPVAAGAEGVVEARRGMVVSVSAPASQVGLEVLQQGGTAVDAAVATAFALAVTYPPAGNIGGGGFMLVHPSSARPPVCVDYRETAPAAATREMFSPGESIYGHRIVGVPGTVRGMELAHREFGKLPWKELVLPAVRLAEHGFPVDAALARDLNAILRDEESQRFDELLRVFAPPDGAEAWQAGDRLVQPELARTLRLIAEEGAKAFYRGPIADQIVAEMQAGGGLITKSDLAGYEAKLREPIHGTYRGYDVYGPPPPSSGGVVLVEMLNILEQFDLRRRGRWSVDTIHLMIEAMKRGYADRARHLGDADFVEIPAHLTTKEYGRQLAEQIELGRATPSEALARDIPLAAEGESTTHFSIVDSEGMAVANTYTLERSYGARVVVRGAGFLLNNEMGDFNWRPGHTDRQGAIGTEPNVIEPGKRMLSSQTPTIVARNGRPVLVTGSPGGRTIINTVLCLVLNVLEFEMDVRSAVDAPRLHHGWFPDVVRFEAADAPRFATLIEQLRARAHTVDPRGVRQGDAHTILIDPADGLLRGAADRRISGQALGY